MKSRPAPACFADYNTNSGIRFQKIETDLSNTDTASTKRLGGLESKIAELEMRLIRLETTYLPPPRENAGRNPISVNLRLNTRILICCQLSENATLQRVSRTSVNDGPFFRTYSVLIF
jgi:hypothetical protein